MHSLAAVCHVKLNEINREDSQGCSASLISSKTRRWEEAGHVFMTPCFEAVASERLALYQVSDDSCSMQTNAHNVNIRLNVETLHCST